MTALLNDEVWAGRFGNEYNLRSPGNVLHNTDLLLQMAWRVERLSWASILELGCGTGANLQAWSAIDRSVHLTGVEINPEACEQAARNVPDAQIIQSSIYDWLPWRTWDLVMTKGFLIHVPPARLPQVYGLVHKASSRWIYIAEYYNPKPVELEYRGHKGMLWKRDFAGELLDLYPDLALVDYGFRYHRDDHPQDDLTWFLLEKRK